MDYDCGLFDFKLGLTFDMLKKLERKRTLEDELLLPPSSSESLLQFLHLRPIDTDEELEEIVGVYRELWIYGMIEITILDFL